MSKIKDCKRMTKAILLSCEDWSRYRNQPIKGDYMIHPVTGMYFKLLQPPQRMWSDPPGGITTTIYDALTRAHIALHRTMRW